MRDEGDRGPLANGPATAALAWSLLFAIPSFAWGLGVEFGLSTIAADVEAALGPLASPGFVILTGVAKVMIGLLAYSYSWRVLPIERRWRIRVGLAVFVPLALYALLGTIDHLLMATGLRVIPDTLGQEAVWWHLFLWDPVWLVWAALFGRAIDRYRRATALPAEPPV